MVSELRRAAIGIVARLAKSMVQDGNGTIWNHQRLAQSEKLELTIALGFRHLQSVLQNF